MGRLIAIFVGLMLLVGCADKQVKVETKKVKTPVAVCPDPPQVKRPNLSLNYVSTDNKYAIVKNYEATIEQLLDYSKRLESALEDYEDLGNQRQLEKLLQDDQ